MCNVGRSTDPVFTKQPFQCDYVMSKVVDAHRRASAR